MTETKKKIDVEKNLWMKNKHQWHFQLIKKTSYLQLATKTTSNRIADSLSIGNKNKKKTKRPNFDKSIWTKLINRRLAHYIVLTISNRFLLRTFSVCKWLGSLFRLIVFLFMQFIFNHNYLYRTKNKTIYNCTEQVLFYVSIERAWKMFKPIKKRFLFNEEIVRLFKLKSKYPVEIAK